MTDAYPVGPSADGTDAPYWEAMARGSLALPRCVDCDAWRTPGRLLCASCWSDRRSWQEVRPTGSVHTWIRTHRDFMSELDVAAPYLTVLVALDEAPIRLLGLLIGADDIAIGARVEGAFVRPARARQDVLRWQVAS